MTTSTSTLRSTAGRRFRLVGLLLPLLASVVFALVQLAMLPWLPDPVATHWGADGGADGLGPAWLFPLITLGVCGGLPALLAGASLAGFEREGGARRFRLPAAASGWLVGFVGALSVGSLALQLGLADGRDAPNILPLLGVSAVVAAVLAWAAWRSTTDAPSEDRARTDGPDAVAVSSGERAVWLQTVTMSRGGAIVVAALIAVTTLLVVVVAVADTAVGGRLSAGSWVGLGGMALVVVAVLACAVFRVRVDDHGLTVRSIAGWPRIRVPLDDIARVEVVSVDPMGEYGGWGWRYAVGVGWGVVMRRGEAIRVTRRGGKTFTVTVDDAETGVALLRGLEARSPSA
ncbi:DUF1648 domain-containing protein [Microbacterium marinilacus]|uniref:DUF1648 domain-containing protein n=1 Tax=Microbacterium marinilacus TaxID=415209 RepID=A0ABP7B8W1_9MICO|nr:DUF1648 domain-containing protein [Microbacterium marinilacus]MBY0687405.1 DUF1648 domain-containing protein [Microbacterium marinilacus]